MATDSDYADQQLGNARLNSSTRVPLYQQIFVILRNQIRSGALPAGGKVMGEQALCETFGVSRITARRALNELAESGLVVRQQGRGTRVLRQPTPPAMKASIDGLLENVGHIGRTTTVRVLDFGYIPASGEIADALDIAPGTRIQRAVRVRSLETDHMSYLVTAVPEDVGRLIEGQDMSQTPLLILLEEAGVAVSSATQTISATIADAEVAPLLGVPAGAPLIEVRRIVRDADARPVEYIKILYRPDLYRFEMSLQRIQNSLGKTWSTDWQGTTEKIG